MARFYGKVGFADGTVETPADSGVWVDQIVEYPYYGDVERNTRRNQQGEYLNNDLSVGNSISIVADAYAREHFFKITYVEWSGVRWTVPNVEVKHPRLILDLGEVYNGPIPELPPDDL